MSGFSGMLAGALDGGAQAANQIASAQIEKQNRIDYAREISRMEEQKVQRIAEFQERMRREGVVWGATGEGGTAALDFQKRELDQKADAALRADIAHYGSKELLDARIAAENSIAAGTADAKAAAEGKIVRAKAENTPYELAPGQQRYVGADRIASNDRLTSAEVTKILHESGLKTGSTSKLDRMSEAGKVQLQGIIAEEKSLALEWQKAIINDQTIKEDPSDKRFTAFVRARQDLQIQKLRVLANEGVADGAEDAERVLRGEKNPDVLLQAKAQAALIGGDYAKDFDKVIDDALKQMSSPDGKRRAIVAEAERRGDKDYLVNIAGQQSVVGSPKYTGMLASPGRKAVSAATDETTGQSVAGAAFDAARVELRTAQQELLRFGSVQRSVNPDGFTRAQQRYERALHAARSAEADYQAALPTDIERPGFRFANP